MPLLSLLSPAMWLLAAAAVPPEGTASNPAADSNELPAHVLELLDQKRYREALAEIEPLAVRRNQHATFALANFYVCGKVVEFSCAKAEALFTASLTSRNGLPANPEVTRAARNEIAWVHAACTEPGFSRSLDTAQRFSLEALRESFGTPALPYAYDTVAAVVARTQDYAQAARLQRVAIARLKDLARTETVEAYTFAEFDKRLALYERGEPATVDASTAAQNCNALPD